MTGPAGRGSRLLALAACGVLACAARAETLEEAWAMAARSDHRLAAAEAQTESARAQERAARATRLPVVTASASALHFANPPELALAAGGLDLRSPLFSGDDFAMAGVQLQLPLYTGGRVTSGIAAAREARAGAASNEQAERATLRLAVAEAYVEVLRAQRLLASAESSHASLSAHVSDVNTMLERGAVPRSDLLAARVALADAEQQRVRASHRLALARAAYNRRVGEPLEREVQLSENLPAPDALAAEPVEALARRALDGRPELAALEAQARALDRQARAERGEALPQLALTGSRTWLDNEILDRRDFSYVGLGVTWKLFDGGGARQRSSALRSASRAAGSRLADQRSLIELEVRQAWLEVQEARSRAAAARESVAEAEENLRASRELYGAGLATNTQVLEAVALQVAATGNQDNASLDVALASLRLARAIGAP